MERRIMSKLLRWKEHPNKKGLIISGARQVGKTYIARELGKTYSSFLELNFIEDSKACDYFQTSDPRTILMNITMDHPEFKISGVKPLLFLDEIQKCPEAVTAMKFLSIDGKVDVIASGSLLGVNRNHPSSYPVGYVTEMELHPMDFEEYLWALGLSSEQTSIIRKHVREKQPFDPVLLKSLERRFREYMMVGGMPRVVEESIRSTDFSAVIEEQQDILRAYSHDIVAYSEKKHTLIIERAFNIIPEELARTNKRFRFKDIDGKHNIGLREYSEPIDWLEGSGMVNLCYRLNALEHPLQSHIKHNSFKLYLMDTGLLIQMMGNDTRIAIRNGDSGVNEGAIVENIVMQMLSACNLDAYYYEEAGTMELDFIVNIKGELMVIEVKSGKKHRSRSLLKLMADENKNRNVKRWIKLMDGNIGIDENGVEHYPHFCAAFADSMVDDNDIVLDRDPESIRSMEFRHRSGWTDFSFGPDDPSSANNLGNDDHLKSINIPSYFSLYSANIRSSLT